MKLKRIISTGFIASLLALIVAVPAVAQLGGGISTPSFFKRSGSAILLQNSGWDLGSTGQRIANGYFTNIDAATMAISGVVSGGLTVSGAALIYGGITTSNLTATGTSALAGLTFTVATGTSATTTNSFSTNAQATNMSLANGTSTSWFGFSTASGTTLNANTSAIGALTVGTCTGCSTALTATQVAFGSGSNLVSGSANMTYAASTAIQAGSINVLATPNVSSTAYYADGTQVISTNPTKGYFFTGSSNATTSGMTYTPNTLNLQVAGGSAITLNQSAINFNYASNFNSLLNTLGITPQVDATYSLGTSAKRWKDFWATGNATSGSMTIGTAGTAMTQSFTTSTSLDFGNSAAQGTQQLTMAAQGATTAGSFCRMQQSTLQARTDESYSCYISSANVASVVRSCAAVAGCGDPAAATVIIRVTD